MAVGVMPDAEFVPGAAMVPDDATLHAFSDGVFEIVTRAGSFDDDFSLLTVTFA
jgi:serine phosphatase RsbU (regulator of sigma subunit)